MKVVTIKQPYASLIVYGHKKYEFRSWNTHYRGELLIHAGSGEYKESYGLVSHLGMTYPKGAIIGKVKLVNCTKLTPELLKEIGDHPEVYGIKSDYDGYLWHLEDPILLKESIPISGKLGLWNYLK